MWSMFSKGVKSFHDYIRNIVILVLQVSVGDLGCYVVKKGLDPSPKAGEISF